MSAKLFHFSNANGTLNPALPEPIRRRSSQVRQPEAAKPAEEYVDFGKCAVKLGKLFLSAGRVDKILRQSKMPVDEAIDALHGLVTTMFYYIIHKQGGHLPGDNPPGKITNLLVSGKAIQQMASEEFPGDDQGREALRKLIQKNAQIIFPDTYAITLPNKEQIEVFAEKLQLRMRNTLRGQLPKFIDERRAILREREKELRNTSVNVTVFSPRS